MLFHTKEIYFLEQLNKELVNIYIHRPINKDEIIESYAGVRPLIKSKAKDFHSSSRDFYIQKDKNLLSIARNIVRIVNNE